MTLLKKIKMIRTKGIFIGTLGAALLTINSCVLYTPYKRPSMEMPDEWRAENNDLSTVANVEWWKSLGDCVLDRLIEEALENNKQIQVAVARVAEYRAMLGIVDSQFYPQINAQAYASRQRISKRLGISSGNNTSGAYSSAIDPIDPVLGVLPVTNSNFSPFFNDFRGVFNLSYQFDFWGKIRSASDASYAELLAQVENRRTVVLTVVTSVASAYITLRQYDRQLQIAIQTLESRQESYNLALIRFEEGLTSELEVKQAASEVDEAKVQIVQLNNLIPQQENLISVLIGHPPVDIERGSTIEQWVSTPEIPSGMPADILEQRPDVIAAEDMLIAANARIGVARAMFLPDLTLTGYYGTESSQLRHLFTDPTKVWQIAGNLLQPIFEGGRLISNLDLSNAVKREAYYNYQQVILNALQEVDNALIAHEQSKKGLIVQQARVKDLSEYLDLATLQYENGLVDYLNVLDAQRRLFAAQLDLAQAQAYIYTTMVGIYQALGGGWVIEADNEVLCPSGE